MKKNSIAQAILAIIIVISFTIKVGHAIHDVKWAFEREYPGAVSHLRVVVIRSLDSFFANAEDSDHRPDTSMLLN
jgi:hypothetical protein